MARGRRNRQALIQAAVSLFVEQGYDATTTDEIAALAGVSPRTLFHHFATKEDILFDSYAERLDTAIRRFRLTEGSLGDALAESARAVAEAITDQGQVFRVRARMYSSVPALRARMLAINEVWIDKMAEEAAARLSLPVDADVRPRVAAATVNSANRAAIEIWLAGDGTDSLERLIEEAITLLRPSIDGIEESARKPVDEGTKGRADADL